VRHTLLPALAFNSLHDANNEPYLYKHKWPSQSSGDIRTGAGEQRA